MPRLIITRALEQVNGLDDVYLFFLSQSTFEIVHSLLHQAEWDIETEEQRDVYRRASQELMTMANLQDLVDAVNNGNDIMALMKDCICELNVATDVSRFSLPPEYHGENPSYVPGMEFRQGLPIPDAVAASGVTDWAGYQDYVCKATEYIRRSTVIMNEELLRIADIPGISATLISASLGTVTAILATLALPVIVVGAAAIAAMASAMIAVGQAGLEATRDFLADSSNTVWRDIACIIRNAPNSVLAHEQIMEYISENAPTAAKPVLYLFPFDSWVDQIYKGETALGVNLSPSGLTSLCGGCDSPPGGELVTDPEIDDDTMSSYYMHDDSPCQTMPTWYQGIATPGCHVPASWLSTDIEVLSTDVGETLLVEWTMSKAGSAPGTVLVVMIERIETETVVVEWERTNQNGVWLGSGEFVPTSAGMYRVTMVLNHEASYFDRISVRR